MTIRIEKPEFLFREQLNAIDSNIPVSKMPNGSVIQVATRHTQGNQSGGTYVSTNNTSSVDVTGLSVPITPKHHGSLMMIIVNINSIYLQLGGTTNAFHNFRIVRLFDGQTFTPVYHSTYVDAEVGRGVDNTGFHQARCYTVFDEPSTQERITYKLQVRQGTSNSMQLLFNDTYSTSTITVMEIKQ